MRKDTQILKAPLAQSLAGKWKLIRGNYILYVMLLLPLAYFVVFKYIPMTNIVIAFKDYNMFKTVWESPWAEDLLKYFKMAFSSLDFVRALRNTILLNFLDLVFGFPFPILLALMLNEIAFKRFKRVTQTILYMPHFLSWIIISGMAMHIFAPEKGMINILLSRMGQMTIPFLSDTTLWVITYVGLGVWQSAGYNTIVYLAAITGINPELYEASEIDGAGRLRKILHVTLPGIRPTIVVMLILNLGRILNISFDRPYALGNFLVRDWSDVISTYVYRVGIQSQQFSLATAVGLFQSVVCVIFLVSANVISERMGERGIW
jgi:putative aldouronate transport system permease protein